MHAPHSVTTTTSASVASFSRSVRRRACRMQEGLYMIINAERATATFTRRLASVTGIGRHAEGTTSTSYLTRKRPRPSRGRKCVTPRQSGDSRRTQRRSTSAPLILASCFSLLARDINPPHLLQSISHDTNPDDHRVLVKIHCSVVAPNGSESCSVVYHDLSTIL